MLFSTLENMGISSQDILSFIKKLEDSRLSTHDVIIMRKGHIVYEAYVNAQGEKELSFALCDNEFSEFPEDGYSDEIGSQKGTGRYKCATSAAWTSQNIMPDYITNAFPALLKRNGLRKIRFHDLRHPYVKLKLKILSAYFSRTFGAKVLDFPHDFNPVIGIYTHLFDKHIGKCLR